VEIVKSVMHWSGEYSIDSMRSTRHKKRKTTFYGYKKMTDFVVIGLICEVSRIVSLKTFIQLLYFYLYTDEECRREEFYRSRGMINKKKEGKLTLQIHMKYTLLTIV